MIKLHTLQYDIIINGGKMKKTWTEKLNDSKDLPKVVKLNSAAAYHWKGNTMVVPSPLEVDKIMKKVPGGKLITINEIRQALAKKFKADIGCPLTSGIFVWIAANAAEEQKEKGSVKYTPWWRTLKSGGQLNEKYPGGVEHQKILLETEGHKIIRRGKKLFVENFESNIV